MVCVKLVQCKNLSSQNNRNLFGFLDVASMVLSLPHDMPVVIPEQRTDILLMLHSPEVCYPTGIVADNHVIK